MTSLSAFRPEHEHWRMKLIWKQVTTAFRFCSCCFAGRMTPTIEAGR